MTSKTYIVFDDFELKLFSVFLTIWLLSYYHPYLKLSPEKLSNIHSVPLCILAFLSLQQIIPESIPLCYSSSFFVVDIIDEGFINRDVMWTAHGVISLGLNLGTAMSPLHRQLRSVSKGYLVEGSTLPFNYWKRSKSYGSFVVFFASFTVFRVMWVPYFLYETYVKEMKGETDFLLFLSVMFCLLNGAWYVKMCQMLVNYRVPKKME
ncbi:hypothetical protein QTG54_013569 [Skeletonema marinoi]|uniref:TLC domain-containing protein n=1 Tax=Skeletonema marinoi TaxID=267567 RepID=A0AAD8XY54_9STRA|nr:hypothetical protein QTG54_013569 [Skeletonema marinoi]